MLSVLDSVKSKMKGTKQPSIHGQVLLYYTTCLSTGIVEILSDLEYFIIRVQSFSFEEDGAAMVPVGMSYIGRTEHNSKITDCSLRVQRCRDNIIKYIMFPYVATTGVEFLLIDCKCLVT